jgi:hypothetical protein
VLTGWILVECWGFIANLLSRGFGTPVRSGV